MREIIGINERKRDLCLNASSDQNLNHCQNQRRASKQVTFHHSPLTHSLFRLTSSLIPSLSTFFILPQLIQFSFSSYPLSLILLSWWLKMQDEVEIGFLHHPSHHHHLSHFHSSPFASSYTSAGGTHPGDNQPSSPSSSTPTSVGHQILLATTSTTGHLHQLQHQQPSHHHLLHHYAQSGQSPHTLLTNGTNGLATPPNSNQSNNETASNHSNSSSGENRSDSSKKKRKFKQTFIQFRSILLHLFSSLSHVFFPSLSNTSHNFINRESYIARDLKLIYTIYIYS